MAQQIIPLRLPWDAVSRGVTAAPGHTLAAGLGPLVLAPCGSTVRAAGVPYPLPVHGPPFPLPIVGKVQAYDLPVAGRTEEGDLRVRAGGAAMTLRMEEQIPYSRRCARGTTDHDTPEVSKRAIEFVDTLVSTMLELRLCAEYFAGRIAWELVSPISDWLVPAKGEFEPAGRLPLARLPWPVVGKCLLGKREQPRMDVIVRIAQEFEKPLVRLAEAPRRILRRERSMTGLGSVQEIDDACLEWLVRQPGRTPVQKAGPRQEMLAVIRYESYDTLENRVLKDFLRRCRDAADLYVDQSRKYSGTERYELVARFRDRCKGLLALEQWAGVSGLHGIPQPNYVLQHDRSYRELWKWYLQLVHRERQTDEAWRWQRRLWAEMIRLGVGAAIYELATAEAGKNAEVLIEAPYEHSVWFRNEQDCGTWAAAVDWPGPLVVSRAGKPDVIVECVHSHNPRVAACHRRELLPDWCGAVGADLAVLFCPLGGHNVGRDVCLFVWAVHCATEEPSDSRVTDQPQQAYQALLRLQNELRDDNIVFKGIIMRSRLDGGSEDLPYAGKVDGTEVVGLTLFADPDQWRKELLELLRIHICNCADTCFR